MFQPNVGRRTVMMRNEPDNKIIHNFIYTSQVTDAVVYTIFDVTFIPRPRAANRYRVRSL